MSALEPDLASFIQEQRLARPGENGKWTPLTGGVSSDIWRVDTAKGSFCVKRALAQLKVEAEWRVDIGRNAFEWAYIETVSAIAPGSVPQPLAHDAHRGLFAMAWLSPAYHRLWKEDLLAGRADPDFAASVGHLIGTIHSATADDPAIAATFATDANFHAIRLDPYLLTTAEKHPELSDRIVEVASRIATTRRVLVHGDVSPKNILIGPDGPVLLDAEVAWFGDPAFDLAFCLNHLAIKARVVPGATQALKASFDALASAYLTKVGWEPAATVEERAAALLPALALARVDGKSPVEYLDAFEQGNLRKAASAAILASPVTLAEALDRLLA